MITLKHSINHDEYTAIANSFFDVPMSDETVTEVKDEIVLPKNWQICLICGPSGSGKSTILKNHFGQEHKHQWDDNAIISNFKHLTPKEASEILCAIGLASVPSWLRPYKCLSNGEQFRADLAMNISKNDIIVVDEYTSVVNRSTALAVSNALQKYIRKTNKKIILASCHQDIISVLKPDVLFNPISGNTLYSEDIQKNNIDYYSINNMQLMEQQGNIKVR